MPFALAPFCFYDHFRRRERQRNHRLERAPQTRDEAVVDQRLGVSARGDVEIEVLLEHHRHADVERQATQ
jgi:hypothetical protein